MPTYGYECLSCDNQFEITQSIKADALTTCEACGGTLRKRIYPVGISFKGSGFYVNDYAPKSGASPKPGGDKAEASPESGAAEPKTDVKADAKPEAAGGEPAQSEAPKAETKPDSAPAPKADSKTPAAA